MKVLVLSNGRGEDQLAVTFLMSFIKSSPVSGLEIEAVPLVGNGMAYERAGIKVAGSWGEMPSGGFLALNFKSWIKDLQNGLLIQIVKQFLWVKKIISRYDIIITVGDFTSVFFLSLMKHPPHFHIDTALSSHLRHFYNFEIKVFREHCKAVFTRDELTYEELLKAGVTAYFEGSLMLDDMNMKTENLINFSFKEKSMNILIPSSRSDAFKNMEYFLRILNQRKFNGDFILSVSKNIVMDEVFDLLKSNGFEKLFYGNEDTLYFIKENKNRIYIWTGSLGSLLPYAHSAIGMSGTGCEQMAAFGIPLILIQTEMPQSNKKRMKHYKLLLGNCCEVLDGKPAEQSEKLDDLLQDENKLKKMSEEGPLRFGKTGGSMRISKIIRAVYDSFL